MKYPIGKRTDSQPAVVNCSFQWEFQCPKKWDSLIRAGRDDVRLCWRCQKLVYRCDTPADVTRALELGRCIAVPGAPGDADTLGYMLGIPSES
jgi:hypothetical protein